MDANNVGYANHPTKNSETTWPTLRRVCRFLQLLTAFTALCLYARLLDLQHRYYVHPTTTCIVAIVIAALSILTLMVYALPSVKTYRWFFLWDAGISTAWFCVAGYSLAYYTYVTYNYHHYGMVRNISHKYMYLVRAAISFSMTSGILWLVSAVYERIRFRRAKLSRAMTEDNVFPLESTTPVV